MEVEVVYWKNDIGGVISKKKVDVLPYGYQLSNIAEWRMLIAAEDVEVRAFKPTIIKIEKVDIPENTIVSPLSIMRHALGTVIDVFQPGEPKKVEEKKTITSVVFMPVEDGNVERGQLIGVINVRYVKTSTLKKLKKAIIKELEEARWVPDKGGIIFGK